MKYIRTKDGIYKNASNDKKIIIICRGRNCEVNPNDIIATSNTIEELCDEFLIANREGITPYNEKRWALHTLLYFCDIETDKLYGAIYVKGEKGEPILKSVAILNDEEELELLC